MRLRAHAAHRDEQPIECLPRPAEAEVEQAYYPPDVVGYRLGAAARAQRLQPRNVRSHVLLGSADRLDLGEVPEVPACQPRLSDVQRETPTLLGRRVSEIELATTDQRGGLLLQRERQRGHQCPLAGDVHRATGIPQTIAGDAHTRRRISGPGEADRVIETFGELDRLGGEHRTPGVIGRHFRGVSDHGCAVEAVHGGGGGKLLGAAAEGDDLLVIAGIDRHHACLAQHLQAQRWVSAERCCLLECADPGLEPPRPALDHAAEIQQPHAPVFVGERE